LFSVPILNLNGPVCTAMCFLLELIDAELGVLVTNFFLFVPDLLTVAAVLYLLTRASGDYMLPVLGLNCLITFLVVEGSGLSR
jgi:hypothetical protein